MKINSQTKTLICIGTGGVGKTTLSAALALGLSQQNKKVLVLTIDPSQRLAQALNIKADGEIYSVNKNLDVTTLNHQKVFKEFILKASQKSMTTNEVDKLMNNKLYQQLSTQLSGSQDFTSLYQVNQFVKSEKYDLVILDTPPAQHTWNFLKAPEKLAKLFNEEVAQWFREPENNKRSIFKSILNLGTKQVLSALESLTGSEFIKELGLFFKAVQKWQVPLEKEVLDCQRLLSSHSTEFVLVTALEASRMVEALKLAQEITKQGYNLTNLIVNRFPPNISIEKIHNIYIKKHFMYLDELKNQLTRSKSVLQNNLKVYKSVEVQQNNNHEVELKNVFENLSEL